MFDFSFPELVVVMVVALVVIGPERLPRVARTLGHLWGRMQGFVNRVKADIERDMAVEEFQKLQQKIQAEAGEFEKSVNQAARQLDRGMQQIDEAATQPPAGNQAGSPPSLAAYAGRNKPNAEKSP
ncbi:MAG TPA: Sec-independent protein translocase protein TatB [Gallionella sp.]